MDQHFGAGGKHRRKDFAHPVPQFDIAPRLAGLAFQRISLAVHFRKDVIDAGKILPRRFEPGLRQLALGLEFGDARRFLDQARRSVGLELSSWPTRPCSMMA